MFMFLSHPLDPAGFGWPGEPIVSIEPCSTIEKNGYMSYITKLPNHFGTHMDAPAHFIPGGISINELPIEYFCHTKVALLEIPKDHGEGIHRSDLEPFEDVMSQVSFALIRTGVERYRTTDKDIYASDGPWVAPCAGDYLTENFPGLKGIGVDFLAIGSLSKSAPEGESPADCHWHILGKFSGKFITAVEDMHLSELPKGARITRFFNAPLRVLGLDSSQVVCVAEVE